MLPLTLLSADGCVPGRDGVPDSPLGHLQCADYLVDAPHMLWAFTRAHWLLLLTLALLEVTVRLGWWLWRQHRWRQAVEQAVWLEIVPPVTATPAATYALWQILATVLPAARRFTAYPKRLVWEVHATPAGMRCGMWVPPGINPTAVMRALHRAWPGVRADHAVAPRLTPKRPVVGVALRSTQPDWLPLVEDAAPPTVRRWESAPPEDDRIRAVFDGLAAAGRTGGGLLQVHVIRAPRRRTAVLRRASVNPQRARRQRLLVRALEAVRMALAGALDFLTPGPSGNQRRTATADPVLAEQARQARAKLAAGPHLLVAIRATATGPTSAAARAAAADITSGYSLLSPYWRPRRQRRAARAARTRWVPEAGMQLASAAEAAALAGLPVEPSAYGLPAAGSRRLPAGRDTFTAPADSGPRRPRPQQPDRPGDEPAVWSTS